MKREKWYWDLNLSEAKIKKILSWEDDPRFPRIAGVLLSRVTDPSEVFKLITPNAFCRRWRAIEAEIKSDEWTKEKAAFWKVTYIKLSRDLREKGGKIRQPDKLVLDDFTRDLISKIKESRRKAALSQKELAQLMGYSQQYISGIEKGREKVTLEFLKKFADITKQPLEGFLAINTQISTGKFEPRAFDDLRQKRIYESLSLLGKGPAAYYQDACNLMNGDYLATQTHIVSHCLREIESSLRKVVVEEFNIKVKGEDRQKQEIGLILKGLDIAADSFIADTWFSVAGQDNEDALHGRAHRNALGPPRPKDESFIEFWHGFEEMLDIVLLKFREKFLNCIGVIDALAVKDSPTKNDLDKLRNNVPNGLVGLGYFLDKCKSPKWLMLLDGGGYFNGPRPENAFWPQAMYLKRMAAGEPGLVSKIILKISPTSNNYVHECFIDAALEMPASYSAEWIKKEIARINQQEHLEWGVSSRFGALITHLAMDGQADSALGLARALLRILPDPKKQSPKAEGISFYLPEPRALCDAWDYREITEKSMPVLVKAKGFEVLVFLCGLLNDAIRFSRNEDNNKDFEDYSYIWRKNINHGGEHTHPLANILVSMVRDIAQLLIRDNICKGEDVVLLLEKHKWRVFKRIAIYLLSIYPEKVSKFVGARLTDRALFDDPGIRGEYTLLLKNGSGVLSFEQKQIILGWVEKGFDVEEDKENYKRLKGKYPNNEETELALKQWRRYWLDRCDDKIFEAWEKEHEELVADSVALLDSSGIKEWPGPISPKKIEELSRMTTPEIVDFLKIWKPEGVWPEHDREELGNILLELVKREPERFLGEALSFQQVHPTYIWALIFGLTDGLKEKQGIDLSVVLKLCDWIVKSNNESDADWGNVRRAIGWFLSAMLREDKIAFESRSAAWAIIEPLTHDSDPTIEVERNNINGPATLAINSIRGNAMHAVIQYALWVFQHRGELSGIKENNTFSFEAIPEVKKVLDEHLDFSQDPSLAVHSVYGQWFSWLVALDIKWTKENLSKIFPIQESPELYKAAWDAYIIFCAPQSNVFVVLKEQYDFVLESLSEEKKEENILGHSDRRLVEHLMAFYSQGLFKLDDGETIFSKFWNQAPVRLKAYAIETVGRNLWHAKDIVKLEVLNRLEAFWEARLKSVLESKENVEHGELRAFGGWFVSGKFNDEWAIRQLTKVIEITGTVDISYAVVERLEKLVAQMPEETMNCFEMMVKNDSQGWGIHTWSKSAEIMLKEALKTEAAETARRIINYSASQGYLKFMGLLNDSQDNR